MCNMNNQTILSNLLLIILAARDKMSTKRTTIHKPNPEHSVDFGQDELAEQISGMVQNDPNIHIAVNGPWGSGKTTVLDLAKDALEENTSDMISVWYEPWRYGPDQTTLRRTFLKTLDNTVSDALNKDPLLETERYHFSNIDFEFKSIGEFLSDFFRTFRAQLVYILVFSTVIGLFFLIGQFFISSNPFQFAVSIGWVFVLLSYILLIALFMYMRNDLGSELASTTTFEVKEPRISEIDLFEEQYKKVLERAKNKEKRIVVFIDDIDRCSRNEIREVITGLSTYLDPGEEGADIAFAAAIDGPKIIRAFQASGENSSSGPNILNKTFHVVIPVPTLSRENIRQLIEITSEELDYDMSETDMERIAMASVAFAESNLRTIRSAICEVQWMKNLATEYLRNFGYAESPSFNRILNSDFALYRIALIKLLSNDRDLRKFVTDASIWINGSEQGDLEWGLFDIQPKFERGGLDPRPFLALNSPTDSVAGVDDIGNIRNDAYNGNLDNVREAYRRYDSPTRLHICYELIDSDFVSQDADTQGNAINAAFEIMENSLNSVDSSTYEIFERCLDAMRRHTNIVNSISHNDYPQWFKVASEIGDDALDDIINQKSPFIQQDRNQFLQQLSAEAPEFGSEFVDRVLNIEIEEASKNPQQSSQRTSKIFTNDVIQESERAPDYLIEIVDVWDYGGNPDGPNTALLVDEVIEILHSDKYRNKAEKLYSATVPDGSKIKKAMYEKDWPQPTTDVPHTDSESSENGNNS